MLDIPFLIENSPHLLNSLVGDTMPLESADPRFDHEVMPWVFSAEILALLPVKKGITTYHQYQNWKRSPALRIVLRNGFQFFIGRRISIDATAKTSIQLRLEPQIFAT
jgi:hypothetical protein